VTQPDPFPETTQAAEGLPRRAWTVAEIEAMVRAGIIDEHERFELLGGEVVPMSPKGARHEWVKIVLNRHLQQSVGREFWIAPETTLRLDPKSFVEPDFCIWPSSIMPGDMRGYDVLLAVEVADTSLAFDRGRKIGIYAAYGIGEVWVVDANSLMTRTHKRLGAEGYRDISDARPDADLVPNLVPNLRVNLVELGLTPL
jgi:Uma2 family endonuclease